MRRRWRTAAGVVWPSQVPPGNLQGQQAGEGGQATSGKPHLVARPAARGGHTLAHTNHPNPIALTLTAQPVVGECRQRIATHCGEPAGRQATLVSKAGRPLCKGAGYLGMTPQAALSKGGSPITHRTLRFATVP